MSSIAAINSQASASFALAATAAGSAANVGAAAGVGGPAASASVQTSSLISMAQNGSSIDNLAALALALLMQKGSQSNQTEDPWKMLVGMAMLGMLGRSSDNGVMISQSSTAMTQAYGAQGAAAAASGFTAQG